MDLATPRWADDIFMLRDETFQPLVIVCTVYISLNFLFTYSSLIFQKGKLSKNRWLPYYVNYLSPNKFDAFMLIYIRHCKAINMLLAWITVTISIPAFIMGIWDSFASEFYQSTSYRIALIAGFVYSLIMFCIFSHMSRNMVFFIDKGIAIGPGDHAPLWFHMTSKGGAKRGLKLIKHAMRHARSTRQPVELSSHFWGNRKVSAKIQEKLAPGYYHDIGLQPEYNPKDSGLIGRYIKAYRDKKLIAINLSLEDGKPVKEHRCILTAKCE